MSAYESDSSSDDEDLQGRGKPPTVHSYGHWNSRKAVDFTGKNAGTMLRSSTYSVGIGENRRVVSHNYLCWQAKSLFEKLEKGLLAKQDRKHVSVDGRDYVTKMMGSKYEQVPFHPDLQPFFDYFLAGVKTLGSLESFELANVQLPNFLVGKLIPVFESRSNHHEFYGNMTALSLSNTGLLADELASIATFLQNNETLESLVLSHNDIESNETAASLARAVKKHPTIRHLDVGDCKLGGGEVGLLSKFLFSCKDLDYLSIGHASFGSEGLKLVAKFLGKKINIAQFALVSVPINKECKKVLSKSLAVRNKSSHPLIGLCLRSNEMDLPAVIRGNKNGLTLLDNLSSLELSNNRLPVAGAKVLAKVLRANPALTTLNLSGNRLTNKGARELLAALKDDSATLNHLDISNNWITNSAAPTIVEMLKVNNTLRSLDLSGNSGITATIPGRYEYVSGRWQRSENGDGGRRTIIREALFDTTSLDTIVQSNHTCSVHISGNDNKETYEETIAKINALDSEPLKIRYKVVLAITEVNQDLYDFDKFDNLPIELMPNLFELIGQRIGYAGFGQGVAKKMRKYSKKTSLNRVYQIVSSHQDAPLLFTRGSGAVSKVRKSKKKCKSKGKRKSRGGESDDEDWKPSDRKMKVCR